MSDTGENKYEKNILKIFIFLFFVTAFLGALNVSAGDAPDKYIPQNVHWEGKRVCWDKVEGADGYSLELRIDGYWVNNFFIFKNVNYYDFDELLTMNGNYEVFVSAEIDDDYTARSAGSGFYTVSGIKEYNITGSKECTIRFEALSISKCTPGTKVAVGAAQVEGKCFDHFEISPESVFIEMRDKSYGVFEMPESDVEIKAVYIVPKMLNSVEITDIDRPQYGKTPDFDASLPKDAHYHFATEKELMQTKYRNENISKGVIWYNYETSSSISAMASSDKFSDEHSVY